MTQTFTLGIPVLGRCPDCGRSLEAITVEASQVKFFTWVPVEGAKNGGYYEYTHSCPSCYSQAIRQMRADNASIGR